jgi:ATP diphosphatase
MEQMNQLLEIMKSLRDPDSGCPWDVEQKFSTIAPYTIEEAYEVADAIARDDMDGLCSELGDLLFQVVYHSQLADEQGFFNFSEVTEKINKKMIRRHPHVFADSEITDAKAQSIAWEAIKTQERLNNQGKEGQDEVLQQEKLLDGINQAMPSLARAQKLQDRAATVGFDWNETRAVVDKIKEELMEVEEEINSETRNEQKIEDEIGDLLFACVNLARHFKIDSEAAVRKTNKKFERRFAYIEESLRDQGKGLRDATLEIMDKLWDEAKEDE